MATDTYVLPQTRVFQDVATTPSATAATLNAFIIAPAATLFRYDDADEKALGLLGDYVSSAETCYSWPNRPAGAKVDLTVRKPKLYVDDGKLQFFQDLAGSGSLIKMVAGKSNRIRAASVVFKTNDAADHSASLLDRGVKVGDLAKVRGVVGDDSYTLDTRVTGFVAEVVPAVVGTVTEDADNPANQSASTSVTKTGGADNCVTLASSASSYDGRTDGYINDTYVLTVLEGSAGGDLATATCRLTSASGEDDVASFNPSDNGVQFTVGDRGLLFTFSFDDGECSTDADADDVPYKDLVAGQEWTIVAHGAWTAPVPDEDGTYTGTKDTTYIVTVTRGGLFAADTKPQITVSTNNGYDVSGPTSVTVSAGSVAVGTKGVTIDFTGTGLRKGDIYLIACSAESEGAYRTLILANNLDAAIDETIDLDLTLYLSRSVEIPQNRTASPPDTNFSTSATEICVADGVTLYDSEWTDDGDEVALPLAAGTLYVDYRAWMPAPAASIGSMYDISQIDDIPGPTHEDNPLKYAMFFALLANNGVAVNYIGVTDPDDLDAWTTSISKAEGREDTYGFVPVTHDAEVLAAVLAHVQSQSSPEVSRWRVMWTALEAEPVQMILDTTTSADEEEVLATLSDDPDTSGTQYTILRVPAQNADFVTLGVRALDTVRFLYTTDGFGNEAYTEFTVDAVNSEDELRLVTGHSVAVNTPQKVEIWRSLTATEEAIAIGTKAAAWGSRRVRAVWPDTVGIGDKQVDSVYLCALLAAYRGGIYPHQGMTRLQITGLTDVDRTAKKFNQSQLDEIAVRGGWIVTQSPRDGSIYTRHAVTTGSYSDLSQREEMICANDDHLSYQFLHTWDPYIGIANVTPSMASILETDAIAKINELVNTVYVQRLGPQLLPGSALVSVAPSPTAMDRFIVVIDAIRPAPVNNIDGHLILTVGSF